MLVKHISDAITRAFNYDPTDGQAQFIELIAEFVMDDYQDRVIILKGYAGTGKTSLIAALVGAFKELKQKSMLMAPTGRAAKVLTTYSGKTAYTIHKKIYRQKSAKDGFGNFVLDKNLHTDTLFIIDEASMISNQTIPGSIFGSGNLLNDLVEYVYSARNCKMLVVGDTAQLPPVGLSNSPSLVADTLREFNLQIDEIELTEVVRQEEGSEILSNATFIRNLLRNNEIQSQILQTGYNTDFVRINGTDLLEELSDCYYGDEMGNALVVCRSNKRANKYNEGIRNQILFREATLSVNDFIMVVKNNYFWTEGNDQLDFIANGDIAKIVSIDKTYALYDFNFADVRLQFPDYNDLEIDVKLLTDTLMVEAPSISTEDNRRLYYNVLEDYQHLNTKKKQYNAVKSNPYFNALQVKFAYAVTCHKAQGGQWQKVFIDQGYITEEMINTDYYRWLYTAITRATEKVYLVNFPDMFFRD